MSNTKERITKRRLYLIRKGWAYTKAALLFVSMVLAGFGLIKVMRSIYDLWGFALLFSGFLVLFSIHLFIHLACKAHQEAKQLPYVPPVTADTLPAEEVLVRGSEEPAQEQSKVLLRGTDGSGGTGEQELLRSSQRQEKD